MVSWLSFVMLSKHHLLKHRIAETLLGPNLDVFPDGSMVQVEAQVFTVKDTAADCHVEMAVPEAGRSLGHPNRSVLWTM